MSRHARTLSPDYFDGLYAGEQDPWRFATSDYERAKYAATLGSLTRTRYRSGIEVGCSIGIFTRELADRCDRLVALDVSQAALETARETCRDRPDVLFQQAVVPRDWPSGTFDLVVLSEVMYFLDRPDLAGLAARVAGSIEPGGDVVLVHWLGETDYPLSGDEAAEAFIEALAPTAEPLRGDRTADYRLDVLRAKAAA